MKRGQLVGAVIAGILVLGGGGFAVKTYFFKGEKPPAADGGGGGEFEYFVSVEPVTAREVEWQPTAELVGTVFANRAVSVRNELAGVVVSVGFQSGEIVEAGQVLVVQDDSTDKADLAAAEAAVRIAEASIAQADWQVKLAETELSRLTEVQSRAVADIDRDRARTRVETSKNDLHRWQAEADLARARVDQMKARIAKLTIKAPFRARAAIRTVHEGQYLAEGTEIVTLQEITDGIFLDFAIPQEYAPRVREGTTVMATGELLGPDPVAIRVVAADASVNRDTRNLRVRAVVDNSRGVLVPGMSVRVKVPIDLPRRSVVVPGTAVRRAAYANMVYIIQPDEKGVLRARQRVVQLGQSLGNDVEILDGLKPGERLGGNGSFKLTEGMKVMIGPPPQGDAGRASAGGN